MDTDTLIKQLMSAERTRVTKVENKITKNEWTSEKWKDLNTKIYSLYTGSLSKMRTQGNYLTKKTTSSNESIVKATAGASAPIGTHYVTVESVASAQYVTGGTFASDEKLTSKSKLAEAGIAVGTNISIACGDKTAELLVDENTTFTDLSDACKSAGLNMNFDEARQCLYISSRQSGIENKFSITTSTENATSGAARKGIYELVGYSTLSASDKTAVEDAMATLEASDSTEIATILTKAESDLKDDEKKIKNAYQLLMTKAEAQAKKNADAAAEKKAKEEVNADITAQIMEAVENDTAIDDLYGKAFTADQIVALKTKAEEAAKKMHETDTFKEIYEGVDELKDVTYADVVKLQEKKAADATQLTDSENAILAAYEAKEAEYQAAYDDVYADAIQAHAEKEAAGYNTTERQKK